MVSDPVIRIVPSPPLDRGVQPATKTSARAHANPQAFKIVAVIEFMDGARTLSDVANESAMLPGEDLRPARTLAARGAEQRLALWFRFLMATRSLRHPTRPSAATINCHLSAVGFGPYDTGGLLGFC
jgi:hypothetical protein